MIFKEKKIQSAVIVSSYPYPSNFATANRVRMLESALKLNKIKNIDIISSGKDNTSRAKIRNNIYNISKKKSETKNNPLILRFFNELRFALKVNKFLKKRRYEMVIFTIPSLLLLFAACLNHNKNILIDFRDLSWEYLNKYNFFEYIFTLFICKLVIFASKRSSIILVTNTYEKKILERFIKKRCYIIPNGISKDKYDYLVKNTHIKENIFQNILYVGNIGKAQELKILIDIAKIDREIIINIVGDGVEFKKIQNISHKYHNINLQKQKKWNYLIKDYNAADILFLTLKENFKSALPSKIFEYLVIGKPIVAGLPKGVARDFLSNFDNIFFYEIGNPKSLKNTIKQMKRIKMKSFEANKNKIKSNYLRELHSKQLANLLKKNNFI